MSIPFLSAEILRLNEIYQLVLPHNTTYILYYKLVMLVTFIENPSLHSCIEVINIHINGFLGLPPVHIRDSFMWLFHKELIRFKRQELSIIFFNPNIRKIYYDTVTSFINEDRATASKLIPVLSSAFNDELNSRMFENNISPLQFKGNTFMGDEAVRQLAIFMKSSIHNFNLYLKYI